MYDYVCVILFEIVVITVCWKRLISAERRENVVSFERRLVFFSWWWKIPWIFHGMVKTFCVTAVISSAGFYWLIFCWCFFPPHLFWLFIARIMELASSFFSYHACFVVMFCLSFRRNGLMWVLYVCVWLKACLKPLRQWSNMVKTGWLQIVNLILPSEK